jgi:hypothetical protein
MSCVIQRKAELELPVTWMRFELGISQMQLKRIIVPLDFLQLLFKHTKRETEEKHDIFNHDS